MPRPTPRRIVLCALLSAACSTAQPAASDGAVTSTSDGQSETGVDISAGSGTTGASPTSSPASSTTADPTTGAGAGSSTGDGSFVDGPDAPAVPCDPYAQDCPEGMKCTWYAEDGGTAWTTTTCVALARDPAKIDEPCVAEDGLNGVDDCELGAMCWDVDDAGDGTCVGLCGGSERRPTCPSTHRCQLSRTLALCIASCDPLAQDCGPDELCLPVDHAYVCALDGSGDGGQLHAPCDFFTSCDSGLICLAPTAAAECDPQANGCCEPYCDLGQPDACPAAGQICRPVFDPQPEAFPHVGYCSVTP